MRKAIIAGSTGLVGSYLVRLLLTDNSYEKVYALVRRKDSIQYEGEGKEKLEEVVVDYHHLDLSSIEADDVFCALGTTIKTAGSKEKFFQVDHDFVLSVAKKCLEKGASNFLMVSSIGANEKSSNFYLHVKGKTESDIKALDFNSTMIFRPSLLLGPRSENRPLEKFGEILLKIVRPFLIGGLRKQIPVHASQVATAMINQAKSAESGNHLLDSNFIRSFIQSE